MLRLHGVLPLLLLFSTLAFGQEDQATLTVRGDAMLEVPADQGRLILAVVTTATTAEEALRENSEKLRMVAKALARAGLEPEEYRTGQFSIHPDWSRPPDQVKPAWKPTIVSYTVTNSLLVTTDKLALVGPLIEAAIKAGANRVEGLAFDLADPNAYRVRAIGLATESAKKDALALAGAAGVRLGPVVSLHLDPAESPPRPMMMRMAESAAPPITPGEVKVRAGLTIVFRIEQD